MENRGRNGMENGGRNGKENGGRPGGRHGTENGVRKCIRVRNKKGRIGSFGYFLPSRGKN